MIHVAHVITGLGPGGAEGFLTNLVPGLERQGIGATVFSLTDDGVHGDDLRRSGVDVCPLGFRTGRPDPRPAVHLAAHLRDVRPDVVMTWLYHADLIGGLAATACGIPVVWNLRQSAMGPAAPDRHHRLVRTNARLSRRVPRRIVCVSERARSDHEAAGYPRDRMEVIHNGFDVQRYEPDAVVRAAVRAELGIPGNAPVIGHVARFDPQKDHLSMLRAASRVATERPDMHLVMCGDGVDRSNQHLGRWIGEVGLDRRSVHLLGRRDDVERLVTAWDVAVSSSAYGEGLTNALGEAMAAGVPCVATASGDARELIGPTGTVVDVGDPAALAAGIVGMLADRTVPVAETRQRIVDRFDLERATDRYARCLREVAAGG